MVSNIQIKISLSVDQVCILIKILVESHMAFNWEIKSTFDSTRTDRPVVKVKVALPLFRATLTFTTGLSVRVLSNVDFISQFFKGQYGISNKMKKQGCPMRTKYLR